ncbi:MAG: adenylosuccinate synthetase, partial [Planctomycetota bacterium]
EGGQGTLLDVDHGTYPYVTSSNTVSGAVCTGVGIGPTHIDEVIGVVKAYTTRVGNGPLPTEAIGASGDRLRDRGGEYGATTGRPRRCGWLDLPALRYALEINDVDSLALTKADVLCGRDAVPVAVGYRLDGKELEGLPVQADALRRIEPIYEEWPGWSEVSRKAMAPFVTRLEERLGRPVSIISTGRRRSEVILSEPFSSYLEVSR